MLLFLSLIPATLAAVVGYFLLLSSADSGRLRDLCRLLAGRNHALDAFRRRALTQAGES